jgi:hypothetical protein
MSYYSATGDLKETAMMAASKALDIVNDPALPKVVSLMNEIKALPSEKMSPTEKGIGLRKIVRPLEIFIAYKKHPWIAPAAVGGLVLTIFALGVFTGKSKRKV